ncbi:MAG: methyltransferase [Bacilli bacterium]|nr:methyltransferase [Bacilli bacterium]MDD4795779.1 methyltransferase [Bacilli bacterium]
MNHYFTNNENLKSEIRVLKYSYGEYNFIFNSDLGVFAKDKIDEGSKLLVETYFKYGKKDVKVLDAGCGYGFVGITLSKVMNVKVDFIDINNRALHLTKMNLKNNKVSGQVFLSNIYDNVNEKYDVIIVNPPIRAGKKVYMKFIEDAFNYLEVDGELWIVMRTNHGVKNIYKNLKITKKSEILSKNKGFYVILTKMS